MGQLTSQFARDFPPEVRARGLAIHRDGAVELLERTTDRAVARVRGGDDHHVQARELQAGRRAAFLCTCPAFGARGPCKHVWALLLALDGQAGARTAGADGGDGAAAAPSAPRDWRARLAGVPVPTARRARPPAPAAPPRLEYFLQVLDRLRQDGSGLAVHVMRRLPRGDGGAGPLHAGGLPAEDLARLPDADRLVIGLLQHHQRSGAPGASARDVGPGAVSLLDPWYLPAVLLPVVLPALVATGKLHRWPPQDGAAGPRVQLDHAEPFRFEVLVDRDATPRTPGHLVVCGRFVRGTQMLPGEAAPAAGERRFLFADDRLVLVDVAGGGELAREFAMGGPIEVPPHEAGDLLRVLSQRPGAESFLRRTLAAVPLGAPSGDVEFGVPFAEHHPCLVGLRIRYGGALLDPLDTGPLVSGGGPLLRRDPAAEAALEERLRAAGRAAGLVEDEELGLVCRPDALPVVVPALLAAGFRVFADGRPLRPYEAGSASVSSGIDWFDLEGEVQFAGYRGNLPTLLRAKLRPGGFVELGDGSTGMLPQRWVQRIEALRQLEAEERGGREGADEDAAPRSLRVPRAQALLLDALLGEAAGDVAVDGHFAALRARLAGFAAVAPVHEPPGFRGELRPYQRQGLAWLSFLCEFGLGGCLADDMGLGKTVQVLAHLLVRRAATPPRDRRPCLLVAPRSVLPNWLAEATRFAPELRVLDFSAPDRWQRHGSALVASDLVLTTYSLVRSDAPRFRERGEHFAMVILDEAQFVKNGDSQTSKAVRLLRADHRLALTGTPVENHLGELWSLFHFLNPGMLGRLTAFRALFGQKQDHEALTANRELIQRALRPVLLRRTKAQVLTDLPPKIEQTLWCDLEPPQRARYDELRDHYRERLLDEAGAPPGERFAVLEGLLRLRQAACHEGLLDPARAGSPSAKFDALLPRLEELAEEGHKALVFSQFTSLLDLLEPRLAERGLRWVRLDGTTRDRATRVERFQQDPATPLFLISLKAGGTGLNLTAASYVFVLDPWWNPAVEAQAIDRAHRLGQRATVNAYRVVCRGTVEEHVLALQGRKKALCEAILGNERSLLQDLTREDLELLLR